MNASQSSKVYYEKHRSEVIRHKTMVNIVSKGQIPREQTIEEHHIELNAVIDAFCQWLTTNPQRKIREKQVRKFSQLVLKKRSSD